jgi:hypothetical protein
MSQTCDDINHTKKSASKALEFFDHTQQQLA